MSRKHTETNTIQRCFCTINASWSGILIPVQKTAGFLTQGSTWFRRLPIVRQWHLSRNTPLLQWRDRTRIALVSLLPFASYKSTVFLALFFLFMHELFFIITYQIWNCNCFSKNFRKYEDFVPFLKSNCVLWKKLFGLSYQHQIKLRQESKLVSKMPKYQIWSLKIF